MAHFKQSSNAGIITSCAGGRHNMPSVTLTFDLLKNGVRVTCDVGYLCANFSLPRPLCSRLRSDVRDIQTDVRQHHRLMPRLGGRGRGIMNVITEMQMSTQYIVVFKWLSERN